MDRRSLSISLTVGALAACLVAFIGSRCTGGQADCVVYDAPRDGWLLDYDQQGEVALWSQPAQVAEDGGEITATVDFRAGGEPVGGSISIVVLEECTINGILYHRVDAGELGTGWVNAIYVLWERR
jgi:hypothetical protein